MLVEVVRTGKQGLEVGGKRSVEVCGGQCSVRRMTCPKHSKETMFTLETRPTIFSVIVLMID